MRPVDSFSPLTRSLGGNRLAYSLALRGGRRRAGEPATAHTDKGVWTLKQAVSLHCSCSATREHKPARPLVDEVKNWFTGAARPWLAVHEGVHASTPPLCKTLCCHGRTLSCVSGGSCQPPQHHHQASPQPSQGTCLCSACRAASSLSGAANLGAWRRRWRCSTC
jgi:hypothetical protein